MPVPSKSGPGFVTAVSSIGTRKTMEEMICGTDGF